MLDLVRANRFFRLPMLIVGLVGCALLLIGVGAARSAEFTWTDPLFGKSWELTPIPGEFLLHFKASGAGEFKGNDEVEAEAFVPFLEEIGAAAAEDYRPATQTLRVQANVESAELLAQRITASLDSGTSLPRLSGSVEPGVVLVTPVVRDGEGFTKFFRPHELMIQFNVSLSADEVEARVESSGLSIARDYWTPGLFRFSAPASVDLFEMIDEWAARDDVRFAEPAYLCFDDLLAVSARVPESPNDPLFPNQWGLRNSGAGNWKPTADVQADAAWWIETGQPDVIIAYIDSGADFGHEDLAPNLLPRNGDDWNFQDEESDEPFDVMSHGTAVAGIGSAVQNNGLGISGLAPGARFMPLRVSLEAGDYAERADAINYAASRRADFDAMILNCSWGSASGDFTAQRLAIEDAYAAGCVLVCAAGNSDDAIIYPARYPETIAVGATSPCDERTQSNSCDGENFWGSCFGPELDVVAPGVGIQTTDRTGAFGYTSTNYHAGFNGTSSSAPLASATLALLYSVDAGLNGEDARQLLHAGADDEVGRPGEDGPGFDIYHGFGRVNAYRSLVLATHPDGINDDLETGAARWKHEPLENGLDVWNLSSSDNHTTGGSFSWNSAEPGSGAYPPGTHAALYAPDFWVPAEGRLKFWHQMNVTEFSSGIAADGGRLEVSTDGAESWEPLVPEGGYTHVTGVLSDPFPMSTSVFSGDFDWIESEVDLSSYANGPIRIRFIFGSRPDLDPESAGSGWWIDDVRIVVSPSSTPETNERVRESALWMSVPSIVTDAVEVRFGQSDGGGAFLTDVSWTLYGPNGRALMSDRLPQLGPEPAVFIFDPAQSGEAIASSGVYFLRLRAGREAVTQKLTVLR